MSDKCLTLKCTRPRTANPGRGLCMICYSRAKKLVEADQTTWKELVDMGLALPTGGEDPFTEAFNKAKQDAGTTGTDN